MKTKLFCEAFSIFELDNVKNETILRDFLSLRLTTSKTKQFCETSFKNGKLSAELTASYQCVLRFFKKVMPGHTKCCTCHTKSSWQTWRSDAPKCNPLSGNQRPDLLTSLMDISLVLRLPREIHLSSSSSNAACLPLFLEMLQPPIRRVRGGFGGGYGVTYLLRTFTPPPKCKSSGARFLT